VGSVVRVITGFVQDDEGEWVAELSCGHRQHVRHRPPFQKRPWVLDEPGRRSRVGAPIECRLCDEAACYADLVCPDCGGIMGDAHPDVACGR